MKAKIFLCGFMGSGKTTVGRLLAEDMRCVFADTDLLIEERQNMMASAIFKQKGETFFRQQETQELSRLIKKSDPIVIALGGGSLMDYNNLRMILNAGLLIYLKCDLDIIRERLRSCTARPLLNTGELMLLYHVRLIHYAFASIVVDVAGKTPAQIIAEIKSQITDIKMLMAEQKNRVF